MKKTKTLYWIFTGLFAGLMLFSAVPNILILPDSIKFMNNLGYPTYFIPFIGWAKALGVIAILIPGFPRIKEWANAGLTFDLIGATYSIIALNGFSPDQSLMFVFIAFGFLSYYFYHKKIKA